MLRKSITIPLTAVAVTLAWAAACTAQPTATGTRIPSSEYFPFTSGAGANYLRSDYVDGDRKVPALLKQANVACTPVQSLHLGQVGAVDPQTHKPVKLELYETACASGMGFVLAVSPGGPVEASDCIEAAQGGRFACMLPKNSHFAGGLDGFITAAGVKSCGALRARLMGEDKQTGVRRYEVACGAGGGLVLDTPMKSGSGAAPAAYDCLQLPDTCIFTPHVESVAMLAARSAKALGSRCAVGDARYVGYAQATARDVYELGCRGAEGFVVQVDKSGTTTGIQPCSQIKLIGSACRLKVEAVDPLITLAQASGARDPATVKNPDWTRRPSGDAMGKYYPSKAAGLGLAGGAMLSCRISAAGTLQDCFTFDESPAGYGFGQAALAMSTAFKMRPQLVNGVPVSGPHVIIPISFGVR